MERVALGNENGDCLSLNIPFVNYDPRCRRWDVLDIEAHAQPKGQQLCVSTNEMVGRCFSGRYTRRDVRNSLDLIGRMSTWTEASLRLPTLKTKKTVRAFN